MNTNMYAYIHIYTYTYTGNIPSSLVALASAPAIYTYIYGFTHLPIHTGWRRVIGSLIFIGHVLQK